MPRVFRDLLLGVLLYGWAVPLAWAVSLTLAAVQSATGDRLESFPHAAAADAMVTVALVWMTAAALAAVVGVVRRRSGGAD